ncbi:MAG TPA: TIM barrel protein [Planctomycetaceae bacterium]|nr:TIM barrel protein [Planctomycetaceae bacterium]
MRSRFRLALATRCWSSAPWNNWPEIASTGAEAVQLDVRTELSPTQLTTTGRRDFLHRLRETGLRVSSTVFPLKRPLYDQNELDRKLAAIREAMEFTHSLQSSVMCIPLGKLPAADRTKDQQLLRELLQDLAAFGNHVGVTPVWAPVGDGAEDVATLLREITTGPVGIDFDPAYFTMTGRSSSESLKVIGDLTAHVQLRDGVRMLDGGGDETAVTEGAVDWVELLALLSEMEYSGWLTAIRLQGPDRAGDCIRAIQFVQRTLLGG